LVKAARRDAVATREDITMPSSADAGPGAAYVAGTFDTKGHELSFIAECLRGMGVRTVTVDLSTTGKASSADIQASVVAACHPGGASAVFTGDRGSAVAAMTEAFRHFVRTRTDLSGLISAGGSGGTALVTPAMRDLAVGVPKVMVSTMASGDVRAYVGPSDICMMYSVTDVSGINRISEQVLSNAAHALGGMITQHRPPSAASKPVIGLTMFGVTTPCVQGVAAALEDRYDCLIFHATGTGGQSMEKLADSHMFAGVLDITTTEVCDFLMGGVLACTEDRFGAIIRTKLRYVVSCGALDMVNFGAPETIPAKYAGRKFYPHNPQVTLMRTTPEENARMGRWIGERLNRMEGPVRLLIPEGGVSAIDRPGQAFYDPDANRALFDALEATVIQTANRRVIRRPENVNDPGFIEALVANFREIA
jgi:uncharacterized protein (UPF0261 family)